MLAELRLAACETMTIAVTGAPRREMELKRLIQYVERDSSRSCRKNEFIMKLAY